MPQTPQTTASHDAGSVTRLIPKAQQGQNDALNELLHRLGTDFAARLFAGLNTLQQADREIVASRTQLVISRRIREATFKTPENREAFFRWVWGINRKQLSDHNRSKKAKKRERIAEVPLQEHDLPARGAAPEKLVWQRDFVEYLEVRVTEYAQSYDGGETLIRMFAMLKEGHSAAAIQRDLPLTRARYKRLIDLLVSLAKEDGEP